ncbi:unnamed protein product, partial [Pylaiella littoralis]
KNRGERTPTRYLSRIFLPAVEHCLLRLLSVGPRQTLKREIKLRLRVCRIVSAGPFSLRSERGITAASRRKTQVSPSAVVFPPFLHSSVSCVLSSRCGLGPTSR